MCNAVCSHANIKYYILLRTACCRYYYFYCFLFNVLPCDYNIPIVIYNITMLKMKNLKNSACIRHVNIRNNRKVSIHICS